jgi:hypothetical protein
MIEVHTRTASLLSQGPPDRPQGLRRGRHHDQLGRVP